MSTFEKLAGTPPPSPNVEYSFENIYEPLPKFPDVGNLDVPLVREIGIKKSIEVLGSYFDCNKYNQNYLHFWFLDILTDCIWTCQDKFGFPNNITKNVLSWILFAFDLIRGKNDISLLLSARK